MNHKDLVKQDYGIAMIDLNGFVCVIANKLTTQRMDLKVGDVLDINRLGKIEIICIVRKPYWNALNEPVQEVKFICKEV